MSFAIHRRIIPFLLLIPLLTAWLTGCASSSASSNDPHLAMASMDEMPTEVRSAPEAVAQSYQFAFANPDILKQIPCYCGCDDIGHKSNYDCYASNVDANGKITYDPHALGCSICVDITQDSMRLLQQGKSPPEIKGYIDQNYSQYGPSNMP